MEAILDFFSSSVISVTAPSPSTRAWAPRNRHLSPRRHSPASSKYGQVVLGSRDDPGAGSSLVSVATKGGVLVMLLANGSLMSLGLAARYAWMSCVKRHLNVRRRHGLGEMEEGRTRILARRSSRLRCASRALARLVLFRTAGPCWHPGWPSFAARWASCGHLDLDRCLRWDRRGARYVPWILLQRHRRLLDGRRC